MDDQEDLGPNPLVARADALMQRRRPASPFSSESDDVPVLTEIVDGQAEATKPVESPSPALDPAVLDILAHELTRRLNERLENELPALVEAALQATLANLTRDLREKLAANARAAIQDFLEERARLAKLQQSR